MRSKGIIRVSDHAYEILCALSDETEMPISNVASMLIEHKDEALKLSVKGIKVIKSIEIVE